MENFELLWHKYYFIRMFCWFTISFGLYRKLYSLLKCLDLLFCEFEKPEGTRKGRLVWHQSFQCLYPRDNSSYRTCADIWPLYSSNRTSKPGSIIIRWLGMSPRSSPRDLLGKIEDENRENDGNRAHLNLQQTALKSSKNLNALNCGVSSIQCFWAKEI